MFPLICCRAVAAVATAWIASPFLRARPLQGATEPERCPLGVACPPRTEIPSNDFSGVMIDMLLFGVLWAVWRLRWADAGQWIYYMGDVSLLASVVR